MQNNALLQNLSSPFSNLRFFSSPRVGGQNFPYFGSLYDLESDQVSSYFQDGAVSSVMVVDGVNLPMIYSLRFNDHNNGNNAYEESLLGFTPNEIKNSSATFFSEYDVGFRGGCFHKPVGRVINLKSDDKLNKIGEIHGLDLYTLADKSHPLNKLVYEKINKYKTENLETGDDDGVMIFSFEEYVNQNPLLFIKDYWNRWLVFSESDFVFAGEGECGKPVIYLYPEKPTEVSVKFLKLMNFTHVIPYY